MIRYPADVAKGMATFTVNPIYVSFSHYDIEVIDGKRYVMGVVTETQVFVNKEKDIIVKSNYNYIFPATRKMTIEFSEFTSGTIYFGMSYNGGIEEVNGWFPGSIIYVWLDGEKRQLVDGSPGFAYSTMPDIVYAFNIPSGQSLNKIEIILKPSFLDKCEMGITKNL